MVKRLLARLGFFARKKEDIPAPLAPEPEKPWCVYGHEPIVREGVYRLCYQPDLGRTMFPNSSISTGYYVAVLDAAVDGSLGIVVEHLSREVYRRTAVSHVFPRPLPVLTPYDVFDVFWRNVRQPVVLFPHLSQPVFPDDVKPVLYREGGIELLATEPASQRSH